MDSRPVSALAEIGLAGFADLYRAFAGVMSPAEVDECELWQLAAMLGADRETSDDPIDDRAARIEAERDALRERAAKMPGVQLPVEGEAPTDVTAKIMADMGIKLK